MSKLKDLENKVAGLEKQIEELRSQLLSLALRPVGVTAPFVVTPSTTPAPHVPTWPPCFPYIGDPPPGQGNITISCKTPSFQNTAASNS